MTDTDSWDSTPAQETETLNTERFAEYVAKRLRFHNGNMYGCATCFTAETFSRDLFCEEK